MTLLSYNVLGDQLWKREIPLAGNVVQLFNLSDGYAIAGNYLLITDLAGTEFRTRMSEQEANPYFIKIKNSGETSSIKPLSFGTSLVTTRIVKINDSSIHSGSEFLTSKICDQKIISSNCITITEVK